MRPLVFHDSTAELAFWGSFALWVAIEFAVVVRTDSHGRTSREWTLPLLMATILASVVVAGELAERRVAPLLDSGWWPVAVGLGVLWAGVVVRMWAVLTLGPFFKVAVVLQDDHRVIDRGPYRWLRHPSYTGTLMSVVGVGLAFEDWAAIGVLLVCPLIAFLIRIRVEERAMLEELGEEYAAYARRTARLVPGLF